jgi:[glutamine synthetase] adenylyltransferase / [glutamine synthetase]-adenylyl-L-tyrosine phosphorylase
LQPVDFTYFFCILNHWDAFLGLLYYVHMSESELYSNFKDTERAHGLLRDFVETLIGSFDDHGKPYTPDELHRYFLQAIGSIPSPDKALLNIHRMAEASFGISFVRDLVRHPVLLDLALKIGSRSQFLSDVVVRDPELFRWLTTSEVLSVTKSFDDFTIELEKQISLFGKRSTQYNAIRRFYRRELLRIGVRDLLTIEPFETIVREISDLADSISSVVLKTVIADISAKYGGEPTTLFAILALGKLGGRELNYSSDIDVMFLMGEDEIMKTDSHREFHAIDFYSSVADRWIAVMTEHSVEGSLYRIDVRLRPDGNAGPLVRSAQGYRNYYEKRGELWERQMLIKARAIAGDIPFGAAFIDSLQPFVFPATLFQSPKHIISRVKARIEKRLENQNNIKLCRGGIRDIEFIVQVLQLLNGGKDEDIRSGSTLVAIDALHMKKFLDAEEREKLQNAYIFFRKLEHHIQLDENIQRHSIPVEIESRDLFARQAGFGTLQDFEETLQMHLTQVTKMYLDVFGKEEDVSLLDSIIREDIEGEGMQFHLYGFTDEKRTLELVRQLVQGVTSLGVGDHDIHTKELLRSLLPGLLQDASSSLDPDRALLNFLSIVQKNPHPHAVYVTLQRGGIRRALLKVCGYSNNLSLQLGRFPEDLELFINHAQSILGDRDAMQSDLHQHTDRFVFLSVHARFMNEICNIQEVHQILSSIAGKRVREVLAEIYVDFKLQYADIAVLSLGKLSGGELGPGGDLDLILFFDSEKGINAELANKVARELIRRCGMVDEMHIPFDVDMRLRPEGQSGPLAVEVTAFDQYLKKRASLWERQSLVRAKALHGPDAFVSRIDEILERFVYRTPLQDGWVDEIKNMRYRTEGRSKINRYAYIDVKTGSGGLMDIEFIVQTLQLKFGRDLPFMRIPSTLTALMKVKELELFPAEKIDFLYAAYNTYRYLEYFNRMYSDDPSNLVPTGTRELRYLGKQLNITEEPGEFIKNTTVKVREIFSEMMDLIKNDLR